ILHTRWVNRFDALVIGGGGLLSGRHRPLDSVKWLHRVKIPIYLIGVGASPDTLDTCAALVSRASKISVRDKRSMDAVKEVKPDAEFVADAILIDDVHFPPASAAFQNSGKIAFILRKVAGGKAELYKKIADSILVEGDQVYSIFPSADKESGIIRHFPQEK